MIEWGRTLIVTGRQGPNHASSCRAGPQGFLSASRIRPHGGGCVSSRPPKSAIAESAPDPGPPRRRFAVLRKLLTYFSLALAVQLGTGVLTKIVELLVIGDALTTEQFGEYRHYLLVVELGAGAFYFGFDHGLVTFINKGPRNYPLFVRFFLAYALVLGLVSLLAAFITSRFEGFSSTLAVGTIGLFVVAELGKLTFRARMKKGWELTLLALQSMTWSLGCGISVLLWDKPEVIQPGEAWLPTSLSIWWHFAGIALVAAFTLAILGRRMLKEGQGLFEFRPRGEAYAPLWLDYRPLWLAGFAFVLNIKIVELVVDGFLGREAFGRYGYVTSMMLFIHRPLALVQRAALPLFTRHPDEVPKGFRQMVRLNLTIFPLIALGMLGVYDLLLQYKTLSKYADTWPLLALLVAAAPSFTVEYLVATAAMSKGLARNTKRANVTAFFINVPMATLLVWGFSHVGIGPWNAGLVGAALSAMFYPFIFGVLMLWYNRIDLPDYVRFAAWSILRSTFWLGVAIAFLFTVDDHLLWFPVAGLIYLAGAFATGLYRRE
jgi:O-antigen/teichoic acid export membrane protein